jgi:hypothetical protein
LSKHLDEKIDVDEGTASLKDLIDSMSDDSDFIGKVATMNEYCRHSIMESCLKDVYLKYKEKKEDEPGKKRKK